jgi:hypothetical protein
LTSEEAREKKLRAPGMRCAGYSNIVHKGAPASLTNVKIDEANESVNPFGARTKNRQMAHEITKGKKKTIASQ